MKRTEVKLEEVQSVYSGRAGACCCGCAGNYRYPSTVSKEAFKKSHGYDLDPADINDVQVRRIVKIINQGLADRVGLDDSSSYVAVETSTRLYIVYLKEDDGHAAAELAQGAQ